MLHSSSQLRTAYPIAEPRVHIGVARQSGLRRTAGTHRQLVHDHAASGTAAASWKLGDPVPLPLVQIAGVIGLGLVLPVMLFTALYPSNWPALLAAFCAVAVCFAILQSREVEPEPVRKAASRDDATSESRKRHQRRMLTAGVTHELRTPLTILKGRLHAIEDGVILPDDGETARLLRQVEHVLRIVEDFDLLSQNESGAPTLHRRSIGLSEVVGAVVSDLRPLFERHEIVIAESYDGEAVIHADPVRLTQIATNLITNAAKHSAVGGRILIDVERRGGQAWLSVRDEGPGFAPADREHMFAPFWRSKASVARPGCFGTGMGLALTAGLVEAHGGRIVAENRTDTSGACFKVAFPIC
jgi:signal transduction histidine kinase